MVNMPKMWTHPKIQVSFQLNISNNKNPKVNILCQYSKYSLTAASGSAIHPLVPTFLNPKEIQNMFCSIIKYKNRIENFIEYLGKPSRENIARIAKLPYLKSEL